VPPQPSPAWSLWAWSRGRSPRTRSAPRPSTTPTGPRSARGSTTRRTAGRPRTTPCGSGYRWVWLLLLARLSESDVTSGDENGQFLIENKKFYICQVINVHIHFSEVEAQLGGKKKSFNLASVIINSSQKICLEIFCTRKQSQIVVCSSRSALKSTGTGI